MSSASRKNRAETIGKVSAPFIKDTSVIIEKFVEAVKDLFQYCYTDKDLYHDIHNMSDQELFANLTEYLEEIKFTIYDALSQNLDKISLKFLQLCDKQEKFNRYLKVLKEKWKNSGSGLNTHGRHDDRYIRSAKDFVNKLADDEFSRSRSKNRSPIKPQIHRSEFLEEATKRARRTGELRSTRNYSSTQDIPLASTKMNKTPSKQTVSNGTNALPASDIVSPERTTSSRRQLQDFASGDASRSRSKQRTATSKKTVAGLNNGGAIEEVDKLVLAKEEHPNFTREIIDPFTGCKLVCSDKVIVKCICPTDHNRMFLGLEMGKIVEIIPETDKSPKVASLVYSGAHTVYDLVIDCQDRLLFFDGSYTLRMISYNASKTEEISSGEFWGRILAHSKTVANKSGSTGRELVCCSERVTRYYSSSRSTSRKSCLREDSDWRKETSQISLILLMASSSTL